MSQQIEDAEIESVSPERRAMLVATLADAFGADPLHTWLFPDPVARAAAMPRWMTAMIDLAPEGAALEGVLDLACGAVWHPPVRADAQPDDQPGDQPENQHGDPSALIAVLVDTLGETVAWERLGELGRMAAERPEAPHWYLGLVGTRSGGRGQGLATRLLSPRLAECDANGHDAYLESTNPRNVSLYERLGFETTGTLNLGSADGPLITTMWRPAH